jgi:hypothetical protein
VLKFKSVSVIEDTDRNIEFERSPSGAVFIKQRGAFVDLSPSYARSVWSTLFCETLRDEGLPAGFSTSEVMHWLESRDQG